MRTLVLAGLFVGGMFITYMLFFGGVNGSARHAALAARAAADLGEFARARAELFYRDMRRWPASLEDVEFDPQWVSQHREVTEFRYGAGGAIYIALYAEPGKPPSRFAWTPRPPANAYSDKIAWDCLSDLVAAERFMPGCKFVEPGAFTTPATVDVADPGDDSVAVPGLSPQCQAVGRAAYAAALARGQGDSLETFKQSPFITSQYGGPSYADTLAITQWTYSQPRHSPGASQRRALTYRNCRSNA